MVALRIVRRDPAVTGDKSPLIDPRTIGLCTAQAHYALLILKQELLRIRWPDSNVPVVDSVICLPMPRKPATVRLRDLLVPPVNRIHRARIDEVQGSQCRCANSLDRLFSIKTGGIAEVTRKRTPPFRLPRS